MKQELIFHMGPTTVEISNTTRGQKRQRVHFLLQQSAYVRGSLPVGSSEKGAVRNAKQKGVFSGSLQTCRNLILNFLCLGPGVLATSLILGLGGDRGRQISESM